MNLSEFGLQTNTFVSRLLNMMPEIEKTVYSLMEMKRQRKLRNWNPAEGIEDEASMQEQDSSITEQSI